MLDKYKYVIILTLIFITASTIVFYKNKSESLEKDLESSAANYQMLLDKSIELEKSMTEYKESISRQDTKLKELNDKKISYEKKIEELKKELSDFNIKENLQTKPDETIVFINEKINSKFKEISENTQWNIF